MRLARAFLIVSLFSYLTMLAFVANAINIVYEVDFKTDPTATNNGTAISLILIVILLYSLYRNDLNLIWSGVFGAFAFNSFVGLVHWVNYFNGTNINIYMSLWDLLIGVALILESELYVG